MFIRSCKVIVTVMLRMKPVSPGQVCDHLNESYRLALFFSS